MTTVLTEYRLRWLAALTLAASAACSSPPQEPTPTVATPGDAVVLSPAGQQLAGIVVERARAEAPGAELEAVGTVSLDDTRTARIGALVEGVVRATHVNVGDRVRQGGLLAGLDSHEVHDSWGDYRKAIADRRRLEQELTFAGETMARTERLLAAKAASVLEVEQARSAHASTAQQLAMAGAEVQRARESLIHLGVQFGAAGETDAPTVVPVRSPLGGVVLEKLVTTGTTVTPGTALFVVSDISQLWVLAEIDESALARVKVGAVAQVMVSAYPGERFAATVTFIGDSINPETRRVVVRGQLANGDRRLKPGMFARVQLQGAAGSPTVHVPVDAVQDIGERRVVFVPGRDGRYVTRDVETGSERGGRIEIRRGVAVGDQVVVGGAFLLKSQLLAAPDDES